MSTRPLLAALLLCLAVPSQTAYAQPRVSESDKATARTLAREGYGALDKKDYAGALERFTRADALFHAPTVTLGLARAQVGLGKLVSAEGTYKKLLAEPVPPGAPPVVVKAIDDAKKELEALEKQIPHITVRIKGGTAPKVTLDGAELPAATLGAAQSVDPGKHVIHAESAGFAPRDVEVTLAEGASEVVSIELTGTPKQPVPAPAASFWTTRRKIGIAAGGVGILSLGASIGVGVAALGKRSALQKACPDPNNCPSSQQPVIDSYHTLGNASLATMIIGGAGIAAGAILVLLPSKEKPVEKASITPVIGLGFVGAEGRF
ncbi:Hypothetical protein A7982_02041 [Minicystis rosea]|nr:Hypothetical protein A7982_02041 [Minicystis rosea]